MDILLCMDLANRFHSNFEKYKYQKAFLRSKDSNPLLEADSSLFSRCYTLYCRRGRDKFEFNVKRKRNRVGNYPEIESQLMVYIEKHRNKLENGLINLTRADVKERALEISRSIGRGGRENLNVSDFKATDGWLSRLQNRRGIKFCRKPREDKGKL